MESQENLKQNLTTKEIKALAKPEFQANPEKFYPVDTLTRLGFTRHKCPNTCGHYYWRASDARTTCGDSNCLGQYDFISNGFLKEGQQQMTYTDAWKSFETSFTSA